MSCYFYVEKVIILTVGTRCCILPDEGLSKKAETSTRQKAIWTPWLFLNVNMSQSWLSFRKKMFLLPRYRWMLFCLSPNAKCIILCSCSQGFTGNGHACTGENEIQWTIEEIDTGWLKVNICSTIKRKKNTKFSSVSPWWTHQQLWINFHFSKVCHSHFVCSVHKDIRLVGQISMNVCRSCVEVELVQILMAASGVSVLLGSQAKPAALGKMAVCLLFFTNN